MIDLEFRSPIDRAPPVVALCDISGSMNEYTRLFLHFLHALGETRRVSTFLFGTRLTDVTRAMRARDPDDALAKCSTMALDWSGGTRIGDALHRFNRDWSRRVLGQGAITLLITDGLERDDLDTLKAEMERLAKSSRRVIWVNPLLRFGDFAAKAGGFEPCCLMSICSVRSTISPAWSNFAGHCRVAETSPTIQRRGFWRSIDFPL